MTSKITTYLYIIPDSTTGRVYQGYSYIATLLNHKADFVLKYNQVFNVSKGLGGF